jgi:hypothetical protein
MPGKVNQKPALESFTIGGGPRAAGGLMGVPPPAGPPVQADKQIQDVRRAAEGAKGGGSALGDIMVEEWTEIQRIAENVKQIMRTSQVGTFRRNVRFRQPFSGGVRNALRWIVGADVSAKRPYLDSKIGAE